MQRQIIARKINGAIEKSKPTITTTRKRTGQQDIDTDISGRED